MFNVYGTRYVQKKRTYQETVLKIHTEANGGGKQLNSSELSDKSTLC